MCLSTGFDNVPSFCLRCSRLGSSVEVAFKAGPETTCPCSGEGGVKVNFLCVNVTVYLVKPYGFLPVPRHSQLGPASCRFGVALGEF